jgi:hypothetical protein
VARYLVIHTKREDDEMAAAVRPPSRLVDLAKASVEAGGGARWLRTWSPDLNDERIVSMWEAESAAQIEATLERYGFLDDRDAVPLRVREWGPEDVLAAGDD